MISQMFGAAAKVGNGWSLAAFAMAGLVFIVFIFLRQKKTSKNVDRVLTAVIIAIVILAALPVIARTYLENHGVYRLRITVEDPQGMPVNDAKITSSIGGEPKRVEGGWEFDIPTGSKPRDGKLTVYAEVKSAFLAGKTDLELSDDYNLATKVRLAHDTSAHIRGRVVDQRGYPVPAVQVSVVGYAVETATTGSSGQFDLPAHAADGQSVQLAVFKKGLGSISEWRQAGEQPATIVLERK